MRKTVYSPGDAFQAIRFVLPLRWRSTFLPRLTSRRLKNLTFHELRLELNNFLDRFNHSNTPNPKEVMCTSTTGPGFLDVHVHGRDSLMTIRVVEVGDAPKIYQLHVTRTYHNGSPHLKWYAATRNMGWLDDTDPKSLI